MEPILSFHWIQTYSGPHQIQTACQIPLTFMNFDSNELEGNSFSNLNIITSKNENMTFLTIIGLIRYLISETSFTIRKKQDTIVSTVQRLLQLLFLNCSIRVIFPTFIPGESLACTYISTVGSWGRRKDFYLMLFFSIWPQWKDIAVSNFHNWLCPYWHMKLQP